MMEYSQGVNNVEFVMLVCQAINHVYALIKAGEMSCNLYCDTGVQDNNRIYLKKYNSFLCNVIRHLSISIDRNVFLFML